MALIGARSTRSGGAEPFARLPIAADECAEQRGCKGIEPELRITHELQTSGQQVLRIKLEIPAADGSEIPHIGVKRRIRRGLAPGTAGTEAINRLVSITLSYNSEGCSGIAPTLGSKLSDDNRCAFEAAL